MRKIGKIFGSSDKDKKNAEEKEIIRANRFNNKTDERGLKLKSIFTNDNKPAIEKKEVFIADEAETETENYIDDDVVSENSFFSQNIAEDNIREINKSVKNETYNSYDNTEDDTVPEQADEAVPVFASVDDNGDITDGFDEPLAAEKNDTDNLNIFNGSELKKYDSSKMLKKENSKKKAAKKAVLKKGEAEKNAVDKEKIEQELPADMFRKKRPLFMRMLGGFWSFVMFWMLMGGVVLVIIGGMGITLVYAFSDPDLDAKFANLDLNYTSVIYGNDSNSASPVIYEELHNVENRKWFSAAEMPRDILDATVAIEDKRFYSHMGVDIQRTAYATVMYAKSKLIGGDDGGGGSTLTQQLIKVITGDNEVGIERKFMEILRALYIERKYSKPQILEYYLNTVPFGNGCNGIHTAAKYYFDKDPTELTLVECAAIISITNWPVHFDPYTNPQFNKDRRALVLRNMYEQGYITRAEYDEAKNAELELRDRTKKTSVQGVQTYFTDTVFEDVLNALVRERGYTKEAATNYIYTGGLKIYTTIDINIQKIMDDYFRNEDNYLPVEEGEEKQQVSMVVLDPKNGNILGIIGGRGEKDAARLLNRVTQTKRQPGSSIKPISVYGPALEANIITMATAIDDSPVQINGEPIKLLEGEEYAKDPITEEDITVDFRPWPVNYDGKYNGLLDVYIALSNSYNTPSVKVIKKLGVENSFNFAKNMLGMRSLLDSSRDGRFSDKSEAPLAMGSLTDGVTVLEITAAYTSFVNNGIYSTPRTYTRVETYDGKIILENEVDRQVVFSPQTAYIMTHILMRSASVGTSKVSNLDPIATAGKSGTTSSYNDRWFIGYTPYYLAGIWWGYDQPANNENTHQVQMWHDVMSKIHSIKGITEAEFSKPDGLITATYCSVSGMSPGPYCSLDQRGTRVKTGIFKEGTQPVDICDKHHLLYVCTESGQIAHDNCPSATAKVFIDEVRCYPKVTTGTYVKVGDSEYICPPLRADQVLYNDNVLPVYTYMVPEGMYPTISNESKKRYANCLCSAHAASSSPHPWIYSQYSGG